MVGPPQPGGSFVRTAFAAALSDARISGRRRPRWRRRRSRPGKRVSAICGDVFFDRAAVGRGQPGLAPVDDHRGSDFALLQRFGGVQGIGRFGAARKVGGRPRCFRRLRTFPAGLAGPEAMKITTNQIAKTIHFARRPAAKVKDEPLIAYRCLSEESGQVRGVGHGRAAAEVLADVGGRPAVDRRPRLQQLRRARALGRRRRAPGAGAGRHGPRRPAAPGPRRPGRPRGSGRGGSRAPAAGGRSCPDDEWPVSAKRRKTASAWRS